MDLIFVMVFRTPEHTSILRHFVAWLIADGGAIDTPEVDIKDDMTEVRARVGELTDARLMAKCAEEWAMSQRGVEFIGLRDASVPF